MPTKIACAIAVYTLAGLTGEVFCQETKLQDQIKRIAAAEAIMDANGLRGLAESVQATKIPSPCIHSEYWIAQIPDRNGDFWKMERSASDFGLRVARALDEHAAEVQKHDTEREYTESCHTLLNLSQWFRQTPGYGNYFLANRCESIAAVSIAYLIADLTVPNKKIEDLMQRFPSDETSVTFRLETIQSELPGSLEIHPGADTKKSSEQIYRFWGSGGRRLKAWCESNGVPFPPDTRDGLPPDLAFFADDLNGLPRRLGTTSRWKVKRHAVLVLDGAWDVNRRNIDSLWLFRRKVGSFPTTPPSWYREGDLVFTPIRAAFDAPWSPYRKEFGNQDGTAALIYQLVLERRLYDMDTIMARP